MADGVSQVLPGVFALAGVALSFVAAARLEGRKAERERRAEYDQRGFDTIVDFLTTITDIGRTLREAAERYKTFEHVDRERVAATIDTLVAQARRQVIVLRCILGPNSVDLIRLAEDMLGPLHVAVMTTDRAEDLVDPARDLLSLRDAIIDSSPRY